MKSLGSDNTKLLSVVRHKYRNNINVTHRLADDCDEV